jgi:hypothetical protein
MKRIVMAALGATVLWLTPAGAAVITTGSHFWYQPELYQTGLLTPDGVVSVWGSVKTVPALADSGARWYYAVTANSGIYSDIQVTYAMSGNDVFGVAYSAFNPADIQSGYLADSGDTAGGYPPKLSWMQFSVAPGTNFTIVFSDFYGSMAVAETTTEWTIEGFEGGGAPGMQTPEPATFAMLATGLGLCGLARRSRRKSALR